VLAYKSERITTQVPLVGAGADGLGEDVSVFREDGTALHETRPSLLASVGLPGGSRDAETTACYVDRYAVQTA
jgi:hypothetical protein